MKSILIIEDDRVIAELYRQRYSKAGYRVAVAPDGETGLSRLRQYPPDLVHLDLLVAKVNGIEIIRRIRSNPESRTLPILVLSNFGSSELLDQARQAGATRCISKTGSSAAEVVNAVEEMLAAAEPAEKSAPTASGEGRVFTKEQLREEYLRRLPQIRSVLRTHLQNLAQSLSGDRGAALEGMARPAGSIASFAATTGVPTIARLAGMLESFLRELQQRPHLLTPSALRTLARAVDCFDAPAEQIAPGPDATPSDAKLVLCVDDDPLSLEALRTAVKRAGFCSVCLLDPHVAHHVAMQNRFDLMFLDVDMPGLDGYSLCSEIRATDVNWETPIIFVTGIDEFEARAQSNLSGGDDLLGKPFLLPELALKALTMMMLGRQMGP